MQCAKAALVLPFYLSLLCMRTQANLRKTHVIRFEKIRNRNLRENNTIVLFITLFLVYCVFDFLPLLHVHSSPESSPFFSI
jgi:hypothetical protein